MFILFSTALFLSASGTNTDTSDTLQSVQLQEVSVVQTIKENGLMRQQPSSVSLIGKEQLTANHITSLKATSHLVPNLFIPDYGSRLTSAVYIRGIGSRINTPAVGLYVDNIPYVDKSAFDFNFYDIERVDVLRGPQGVLYGQNTMGGLVRIYTKNPFNYEGTDVRLSLASGDAHHTVSLSHSHRFSEQLALSASGYYEGSNGFFRNDYTGRKSDKMKAGGGRMRVLYLPTDRLSMDMMIGYDYSDEGAYPYYFTGALSEAGRPYTDDRMLGEITNNRESRYRRGMLNAGLNLGYQTDRLQWNAVTGYQYIADRMFMDQDFISADIYTLEQNQKIHTLNEEITVKNRDALRWEWLTGLNVMYQTLHTEGPVNFYADGLRWLESNINRMLPSMDKIMMLKGMGFNNMSINFRGESLLMDGTYETPTLGLALFHQSTLHLTDRLSASLGLRLNYEHQQMDYDSPAEVLYGFKMPNDKNERMSVNLQQLQSHLSYKGMLENDRLKLLPKLALKYELDHGSNLYASAAMGQRAGGYNLQMFSDLLQGAMRIDMMEGVKQGVGEYLDQLSANIPSMPKQIPDPENPGSMVTLSEYVKRLMGSNMPQLEQPTTDQVVYKPEYAWNFELGTHLNFGTDNATNEGFSGNVQIDAALFYSRIFDQQIARFAPSGLGRMMVNAGESQSTGGEFAIRYVPNRHLSISGNYGYTYATFLKYEDGQGNDYAGKYVPYVPKHTLNIDAAYSWWLGKNRASASKLTFGANLAGAGRIYWTESYDVSQDLYQQLGARLCLETSRFSVTLWGRNLTDTKYNTFYFESASRGFEQHGKPRQIGIDVSLHF